MLSLQPAAGSTFYLGEISKMLVFSSFAESRQRIAEILRRDKDVRTFAAGMSPADKIAMIKEFSCSGDVLIVDDSAAVGLNLQMCDVVVNYDFPWNPPITQYRLRKIVTYSP